MATEAKHTPGPWHAADREDYATTFIGIGSHGAAIATARITGIIPVAEAEANARLIAAAPDLLAALDEAFKAFAYDDEGPVWADSTIAKARAAIAKVKGE